VDVMEVQGLDGAGGRLGAKRREAGSQESNGGYKDGAMYSVHGGLV
jgi:hypothetical protein